MNSSARCQVMKLTFSSDRDRLFVSASGFRNRTETESVGRCGCLLPVACRVAGTVGPPQAHRSRCTPAAPVADGIGNLLCMIDCHAMIWPHCNRLLLLSQLPDVCACGRHSVHKYGSSRSADYSLYSHHTPAGIGEMWQKCRPSGTASNPAARNSPAHHLQTPQCGGVLIDGRSDLLQCQGPAAMAGTCPPPAGRAAAAWLAQGLLIFQTRAMLIFQTSAFVKAA